ncbi:MAG: glycosyl hydrolase family 18 protein [bacterium]|jgi:spore germination protein
MDRIKPYIKALHRCKPHLNVLLTMLIILAAAPGVVRSLPGNVPAGEEPTATQPNPAAALPSPADPAAPLVESPAPGEPAPGETPSTPADPPVAEAAGSAPSVSRGKAKTGQYTVLGYYTHDYTGDNGSHNTLTAQHSAIDIVCPFQYAVSGSGKLSGDKLNNLMRFASEKNKAVLVLIHNFANGSFSSSVAHQLLNSKTNRANAVQNIYNLLRDSGYDGVHIDIENVLPGDRAAYSAFVAELKAKLAPSYLVTLAVPAKVSDNPKAGWVGGFDYAALGKHADLITLMTYDEHWFGGAAGPIASVGWVEKVVRYAVDTIPRNKILLGIPTYGYDWSAAGTRGVTAAKAVQQASAAGAEIKWDAQAKVPYYYYWKGSTKHTVYYENSRSIGPKLDLVKKYKLAGIGIWKLGSETKDVWPVIRAELEK